MVLDTRALRALSRVLVLLRYCQVKTATSWKVAKRTQLTAALLRFVVSGHGHRAVNHWLRVTVRLNGVDVRYRWSPFMTQKKQWQARSSCSIATRRCWSRQIQMGPNRGGPYRLTNTFVERVVLNEEDHAARSWGVVMQKNRMLFTHEYLLDYVRLIFARVYKLRGISHVRPWPIVSIEQAAATFIQLYTSV